MKKEGKEKKEKNKTHSPESHNPGRPFKRLEHYRNPSILAEMGNGFYTRAGEIHIPECLVVDQTIILSSFGRDIDVAGLGEWRGGYEEHLLLQDPGIYVLWYQLVKSTHDGDYCWGLVWEMLLLLDIGCMLVCCDNTCSYGR